MTTNRIVTLRVHLEAALAKKLGERRKQTGQTVSEVVSEALAHLLGAGDETVFQTSTINALMEGAAEGDMTIGELRTHGDFGLGTFDGLDGEMIELDGKVYQVRSDGHVYPVADATRTPFATVSFFKADQHAEIASDTELAGIIAKIDAMLESRNLFHAIRIEGTFASVKTRAVAKQGKCGNLTDATASQPEFDFSDVAGTIVGFFTPEFMRGVNVPGYHLHFLTADRTGGGHLLECRARRATIEIHRTPEFELESPRTSEFMNAELARDNSKAIEKAER